jgi:predicted transglutaminase-like cysteine proteinase
MMKTTGIKQLLTALTAVFALALPASSAQFGPSAMQVGGLTSQPIGHYEFCQKNVEECSIKTRDTVPPKVTDFGWKTLTEVNFSVNQRIVPMTDEELYGRDEVWTYPTDAGDCEDFVLEKRKELMAKGFPATDLLITVVRKPDGEGHAVLTVRTTQGDFVLDNLNNDVKLWTDTPYTYLKRQAAFDTGRWVSIEQSPEVVVSALQ